MHKLCHSLWVLKPICQNLFGIQQLDGSQLCKLFLALLCLILVWGRTQHSA